MHETRSQATREARLPFVVSESALIAFGTAVAYLIAFSYEAGYLGAFHVPLHLVRVRLESILIVAVVLSSALWLLFYVANLLSLTWPQHPAIQNKVIRVILLLLFPAWNLVNYSFRREDWFIYAIFLVWLLIFEILWPLLVFAKRGSFRERVIADEIAESAHISIGGRIRRQIGSTASTIIVIGFFGGLLAHYAGQAKARTNKEFFTLGNKQAVVVVRAYNDMLICVNVDRQKREFFPEIVLFKPGNGDMLVLTRESIGPLKPRSHKTSPAKGK